MSNRISVQKALFCALIITISLAIPLKGAEKSVLSYTRKLPSIDKVELLKVRYGKWQIEGIQAVKTLADEKAQAFASLWRKQKYYPNAAICHQPIYAVKLYSKGKLLLFASLCWECNNIAFIQPSFKSFYGFDGKSPNGQAMLECFKGVLLN